MLTTALDNYSMQKKAIRGHLQNFLEAHTNWTDDICGANALDRLMEKIGRELTDEYESRIDELEDEVEELDSHNNKLSNEVEELEAKVEDLKAEIDELKTAAKKPRNDKKIIDLQSNQ